MNKRSLAIAAITGMCSAFMFVSCKKDGCTDAAATNYEEKAKKDQEKAQARIDASNAKYEALKAKLEAANQAAISPKQQLRNALFGEGKIGDDMSFAWVNKDNILATFKTFTQTVENNKDAYTREDWDEIKLLYEALGTRKNTVEKEGLSSSDNNEIAGIKIKFAPMLKVNRMGAKAEENAAAKE